MGFERVAEFNFISATHLTDNRRDNCEFRHSAIGDLDDGLHFLCFVQIPDGIRVVSFRKANTREAKKYAKPITLN